MIVAKVNAYTIDPDGYGRWHVECKFCGWLVLANKFDMADRLGADHLAAEHTYPVTQFIRCGHGRTKFHIVNPVGPRDETLCGRTQFVGRTLSRHAIGYPADVCKQCLQRSEQVYQPW